MSSSISSALHGSTERAARATGRQKRPRRIRPAYLRRDLPRELEHVAVEKEEAGQLEHADDPQLVLEPRLCLGEVGAAAAAVPSVLVALDQALSADLRE